MSEFYDPRCPTCAEWWTGIVRWCYTDGHTEVRQVGACTLRDWLRERRGKPCRCYREKGEESDDHSVAGGAQC